MITTFSKYLSNLPGWRTKRRLLVLESDDWGSIRMPSIDAYNALHSAGLDVKSGDNGRFNSLDTLANETDLKYLFDTLSSVRDSVGRNACLTAFSLSANPDFKKIEEGGFNAYFYEPFTTTLTKYHNDSVFQLWKEGERAKLFWPEFHGREHLNVCFWMNSLRKNDKETKLAFKEGLWGFKPHGIGYNSFQAAFDLEVEEEIEEHFKILADGINLFTQIHGRKPSVFVPPNGPINSRVLERASNLGLSFISSPKIYHEPIGNQATKKKYRYLGQKVDNSTILVRNCFFEPSYTGKGYSVEDCWQHIEIAFKMQKPAIISTHRVNYVGGLNSNNRLKGNADLKILLSRVVKKWPQIEFITSKELGEIINHDKKY